MPSTPATAPSRQGSARAAGAAFLAGLIVAGAGCRSAARPGEPLRPGASGAAGFAASAITAASILDAAVGARESEYAAAPGSGAGSMLIRIDPAIAGEYLVHRLTRPGADRPWSPMVDQAWIVTVDGHAALAEEINHTERAELVYDPPLVMFPAVLSPRGDAGAAGTGAVFEQSVRMLVHPLGDRGRTKARGEARQTIVHEGCDAAPTGDRRPAQRIRRTFNASLPPAEVTNVTVQWFDTEGRLLAEDREERTRILGVLTRRNREVWVLRPGEE